MIVKVFMCGIGYCIVFCLISMLFLSLFTQISNARELFRKLEDKCLLENSSFLYQLLQTIRREDLLNLLEADSRQLEETDARPLLSEYRWKHRDVFVKLDYRTGSSVHTSLLLCFLQCDALQNIWGFVSEGSWEHKVFSEGQAGQETDRLVQCENTAVLHSTGQISPDIRQYCWILFFL